MDDEDDLFADTDLDELERAAIASTQHHNASSYYSHSYDSNRNNRRQQPLQQRLLEQSIAQRQEFEFEDEDVVDLDASFSQSQPQSPLRPSQSLRPHRPPEAALQQQRQQPQSRGTTAQQNIPDEATAREQWRVRRFAQTTPGLVSRTLPWQPARPAASMTAQTRTAVSEDTQGVTDDVANLQARIQQLEADKKRLQDAAQEAKSAVFSKAGEIAIVRSNYDKAAKEHERRVASLQKAHDEELARQKHELDLAQRHREQLETDKRFMEHDLAQEADRRKAASRKSLNTDNKTTPRKLQKALPLRDGFDDDQMVIVSPSKSKERTPRGAASRRKRPRTDDSPIRALELSELDVHPASANVSFTSAVASEQASVSKGTTANADLAREDTRFGFLQGVLHHQSDLDGLLTFETLSSCYLPSSPFTSLSSRLLSGESLADKQYEVVFCERILELWQQCLKENLYKPIRLLLYLLRDILTEEPKDTCKPLLPTIVQLCQDTADTVALPIAKAHRQSDPSLLPAAEIAEHILPAEFLSLLLAVAAIIYNDTPLLQIFWQTVEFDFVLLILHKSQPLEQILMMLSLLESSFLPSTFGTISTQNGAVDPNRLPQQQRHQNDLLERLSILLFEIPHESLQPRELLELRSKVIDLLRKLCGTAHGGHCLATHRLAVGRLVRFLHDMVIRLYQYHPETHALTMSLVNATTLLLGHLTSVHGDVIDMRQRLAAVPAGPQKHLVSLSRIAFSEGSSHIEKGISPEAAEQAHRMLDEHLSPEEGEAVIDVFAAR